jgi:nitrite reductase/ring-hydroxylating ferredoxin subunit
VTETNLRQDVLVGPSGDIVDGDGVLLRLDDGREVGVFRVRGRLVAYENRCAHQGGPVCTGVIVGRCEQVLAPDKTVLREVLNEDELHLVCPWHGWEYDLSTGECAANRRYRLRTVEVSERDGNAYLHV